MATTDSLPLPRVLAEVEAVAGRDAALALAAEKGGTEIYLPTPRALGHDHWLVKLIGWGPAEALCRHFCFSMGRASRSGNVVGHGVRVVIPRAEAVLRRLAVRFMTIAGTPCAKIAATLRITERSVTRIRAALRMSGEIE